MRLAAQRRPERLEVPDQNGTSSAKHNTDQTAMATESAVVPQFRRIAVLSHVVATGVKVLVS